MPERIQIRTRPLGMVDTALTKGIARADLSRGIQCGNVVQRVQAIAVHNVAGAVQRDHLQVHVDEWSGRADWRRHDGVRPHAALLQAGFAALVHAMLYARGDVINVWCNMVRQPIPG